MQPLQPILPKYSQNSQYLPIADDPPSMAIGAMAPSMSEHEIQQRIRLACSRGPVRLWRNNSGALVDQQGRLVRFGLAKGSSDLIGLRSLEITPDLVGQRLAQFVALEIKTARGVVSPEQRAFLDLVEQLGGVAAVCRSIEAAEQTLASTPWPSKGPGRLNH